jgi:hypothetical protein
VKDKKSRLTCARPPNRGDQAGETCIRCANHTPLTSKGLPPQRRGISPAPGVSGAETVRVFGWIQASPGGPILANFCRGKPFLPSITLKTSWLAESAAEIARQFWHDHGLEILVVRPIAESRGSAVITLELRAATPPSPYQWVQPDRLGPAAMGGNRLDHHPYGSVAAAPPWYGVGWFGQAENWILRVLSRHHHQLLAPIRQIKAAWMASTVLEAVTTAGKFYFKAVLPRQSSEPRILRKLNQRWLPQVPTLFATNLKRHWMLCHDFGETRLNPESSPECCEAVAALARIQVGELSRIGQWKKLGCPDRTPSVLSAMSDALLGKLPALLLKSRLISAREKDRLQAWTPVFSQLCGELERGPIPDSLHHEDFRPGNVAIGPGGQCIIFDWSDTVIGHPFFSLNRFLDDLPVCPSSSGGSTAEGLSPLAVQVREAYLRGWRDYASTRELQRVFAQSRRLNAVYQLMRFHCAWDLESLLSHPNDSVREQARSVIERILFLT